MTITLELSTDEQAALRAVASAAGMDIGTVLHGLIAQLSAPTATENAGEDLNMDAEERREQAEVEANIQRWHRERGEA